MKAQAKNVSDQIASVRYVATAEQVSALARQVVEGMNADGTYLRVVIAHAQVALGNTKRAKQPAAERETAISILDDVHTELYPAVLRGVAPANESMEERNRRATFARSAVSTIRYFIRQGGDLRAVTLSEATKGSLRRAVQPEEPQGTPIERAFHRARDALLRGAAKLVAKADQEVARQEIEAAISALQELIQAESEPEVQRIPMRGRTGRQIPKSMRTRQ